MKPFYLEPFQMPPAQGDAIWEKDAAREALRLFDKFWDTFLTSGTPNDHLGAVRKAMTCVPSQASLILDNCLDARKKHDRYQQGLAGLQTLGETQLQTLRRDAHYAHWTHANQTFAALRELTK